MAKVGVTFDEVMRGPVSLDEADSKIGAEKGKSGGSFLALHGTVLIEDMDAFVADPDHTGDFSGTVDFTPFGEDLPIGKGVFQLFSKAEQPGIKYMVYEFSFTAQGKTYYGAGRKIVKNTIGVDLWNDTTTLFTQVHKGGDRSGPIIAAGILELGVKELTDLLSTLRAVGASNKTEEVEAVVGFGKLFAGNLWEIYGPTHLSGRGGIGGLWERFKRWLNL